MGVKEANGLNRKDREEDPGSSFDGGYHLIARELHKERVAKTPDRIKYAIHQLEANGISYELKNTDIGHFHCRRKSDGSLVQFWAGTGKILGYDRKRGIHALIRLLNK